MSYFKGDHLRIKTPITTNGRELALDATGRAQYSYSFFPLSAKKRFEAKNARILRSGLKHLAMEITVVNDAPEPQKNLEDFLSGLSAEQLQAALAAKGVTLQPAEDLAGVAANVAAVAKAAAAPVVLEVTAPGEVAEVAAKEIPAPKAPAAPKKATAPKQPQSVSEIMQDIKL